MRKAIVLAVFLVGCRSNPAEFYERARALEREGDNEAALKEYREALKAAPEDIVIHREYQNLMRRIDKAHGDQVLAAYQAKAKNSPGVSLWAYLYRRLLDGPALEDGMRKIIATDPNFFWAHHALAFYLKNAGRYAEAIPEFEWLFGQVKAPPADVYVNAAVCYERVGRSADAERLLISAKERDPSSPLASFGTGLIHMNAKRYPEAIQDFEACIKQAPRFGRAYSLLAQAYHAVGDFAGGRSVLDRVKKYFAEGPDEDLASDFIIHRNRLDNWLFVAWQRVVIDVDLKPEKGDYTLIVEYNRIETAGVKIRYKLLRTESLTFRFIRDVLGSSGTALEPAEIRVWEGPPEYETFLRRVQADSEQVRKRFAK